MSDQLTPAHLRALIAAATPGPWTFQPGTDRDGDSVDLLMAQQGEADPDEDEEWAEVLFSYSVFGERQVSANWELIVELVNHAPALADALEAKELLEYLMGYVLTAKRRNTDEWMEGLVDALNSTEKTIGGNGYCKYFKSDGVIRVLRAAKEAAK